ncbi:hypothetical protein EG359_17260 [Chryseobacterium joostei]|uniref:Uncharacterized protein n=1 Tax=Chryseobacterium joostei TaxID=112234 RepID=A0A1N7IAU0_9FLAO|nr:hypothetical protein EG359_17260 [Chryseobacterium joostei]SIS34216.1 hypothetical protein SAMN05421768_103649 [Chryseobacterium joostei]
MKIALNLILFVNTIYVLICSENQDASVFFFPVFIYVVFGFLRFCHKDFSKYLNTPNHEKNT